MKGDMMFKILSAIGDLTIGVIDVFDVILSSGYGASYGKLQYELSKKQSLRLKKSIEKEIQRRAEQRYYNLIYKLKRDNLIKEIARGDKKFFTLTKKGKAKLSLLKERNSKKLPMTFYQKEEGDKFVIVAFDVPEKEKRKREWLRACLKHLGLKMVQKSVWIGKVKIPKQFVDDLFKLKLIDFVEIFEISKTGSLEHFL